MRFVTLFPKGSNIHLMKDVGQIPYNLFKYHGIETVLVSDNIFGGVYIDEVEGMEIEETGWRNLNWRVSGTLYIMKNARKIDWLNIYHFGRISILWMMLYKILNKFGKIYLKLDIDQKAIEQLKKSRLLQQIFKWNTKLSDIVSAESALIVGQLDNFTNKHIELVHNGFSLKNETGRVLKKENLFLTVGRLGTKQKATDVLLKAFVESADFQDWDLKLIGPVEPDFRNCIKELVEKYPKPELFMRL